MPKQYYGGMFVNAIPQARDNQPGYLVTYVDYGNKEVWVPADFFERFFKAL
jgi:hypothetical protein